MCGIRLRIKTLGAVPVRRGQTGLLRKPKTNRMKESTL